MDTLESNQNQTPTTPPLYPPEDPAVKEEARNHSGDREHYELTALMNGMQYVDSIVGVVRQRVY